MIQLCLLPGNVKRVKLCDNTKLRYVAADVNITDTDSVTLW